MQDNLYYNQAQCLSVVDGDTIKVRTDLSRHLCIEETLRFYGVNTPERSQEGYEEAKQFVVGMVTGKKLIIRSYKADSFGRYLADVYVQVEEEWVHLNQRLLDEGLAVVYRK